MFASLIPLLGLLGGLIPILVACIIFALLFSDILTCQGAHGIPGVQCNGIIIKYFQNLFR